MQITSQKQWHKWTGHTIYGASAGAMNFIAQQNGYVPVHIMDLEDMFFIRKDVLQEQCDLQTVPSYEKLSAHLPIHLHPQCTSDDLERVQDLQLALSGDTGAAHAKAVSLMKERASWMCFPSAFSAASQNPDPTYPTAR